MLIFVLQTIWLYIKELAGKDLDVIVIAKFLLYFSPKLIPLVLPLTILLASIMVFGNFAENYEFAAMKSTGISLQRSMAGLSIFIVIIGVTTFFFSNNVIPWAEYNSYNLRKNIAKLKPAMAIAEGQFNDVGNINIKVAKKSGERGQYLKDIVIHKKSPRGIGNYTTIIADNGELIGEEDSDIIQLILFDGNYYDDTPPKKYKDKNRRPFVKSYFEKYTFNIDLSNLNNVDLDDKNYSDKYTMLNISDLNYTIDSLKIEQKSDYKDFSKSLYNRAGIPNLNKGLNINKDSLQVQDTLKTKDFINHLNSTKKEQLIDIAINSVTSTQQIISTKRQNLKGKNIWLNKHIMALHDKIALGLACIILFFVGAPLGALIRKGGLGLPMVVAIFLFLTYHFIGIFAKNSAKDGSFSPVFATWFSTLIMLPLGIYLTKRATADRGLFDIDGFIEPIKALFKSKDKSFTKKNDQGLHIEEALVGSIKRSFSNYKSYSKFAIIHYSISVVLFVLYFVFKNNKLQPLADASIQISAIALVIFIIYCIWSYTHMRAIYNSLNRPERKPNTILLILGLPFYFLTYKLLGNKLKEDLKQIV